MSKYYGAGCEVFYYSEEMCAAVPSLNPNCECAFHACGIAFPSHFICIDKLFLCGCAFRCLNLYVCPSVSPSVLWRWETILLVASTCKMQNFVMTRGHPLALVLLNRIAHNLLRMVSQPSFPHPDPYRLF